MEIKNIQEHRKPRGIITVSSYKAGTIKKVMPFIEQLNVILRGPREIRLAKWKEEFDLRKKINRIMLSNKIGEISKNNTIMEASGIGTDLILQQLMGAAVTPTYGLAINYIAIGTGNTTPTITDTQLTTETNRSVVLYAQELSYTQIILQAFFPDTTLVNQTYYEAGGFVGGSASANSGQIFNHGLFGTPYAKVSGQDTTVQITINM